MENHHACSHYKHSCSKLEVKTKRGLIRLVLLWPRIRLLAVATITLRSVRSSASPWQESQHASGL